MPERTTATRPPTIPQGAIRTGARRSPLLHYGLALVLTSIALLVTGLLPLPNRAVIFVLPLAAVVISAWYGGRGPGLFSVVVGAVGIDLAVPRTLADFESASVWVSLIVFVGTSLLMVEFGSARKRNALALRRSEFYLAEAQTLSHTGSWAWDVRLQRAVYWSPEMYRIHGFDPSAGPPPPEADRTRHHPEDWTRLRSAVEAAVRDRSVFECDSRLLLPDGSIRHVRVVGRPVIDAGGEVVRLVGTNIDITAQVAARAELEKAFDEVRQSEEHLRAVVEEQRRAEEALRRNETFLAEAQRLTRTGSFAYDPARDIYLHWSPELNVILGVDSDGRPPSFDRSRIRVHDDDWDRLVAVRRRALEEGIDYSIEFRVARPDGEIRHCQTVAHAIRGPAGEVTQLVGTIVDVTERKRAEAERTSLERRLRQAEKMEAVGRLAGGIAHDFNNILGGILGYSEMLVEQTDEGTPLRRYARNVLTAAERARSLVDQILAYSHRQQVRREPVDFAGVAREVLELLDGRLGEGIEVRASLPDAPLPVLGDATQLHQVVMNLCTNALHAMEGGGVLSVALDTVEVGFERGLTQGSLVPGAYARLEVRDTGTGMDETTLAHIFEPFFTTKEVGRGTGLGLSLVYGIVLDARGGIDVKSAAGAGSAFSIYLPRLETV